MSSEKEIILKVDHKSRIGIDDVINIRGHRIGSEELESVVLKNKILVNVVQFHLLI